MKGFRGRPIRGTLPKEEFGGYKTEVKEIIEER